MIRALGHEIQRLRHFPPGVAKNNLAAIRQAAELSSGLKEVQAAQLNWDGLNVERDPTRLENQYNEVLSRVRFRMARYL